jgi:hypothetical protein
MSSYTLFNIEARWPRLVRCYRLLTRYYSQLSSVSRPSPLSSTRDSTDQSHTSYYLSIIQSNVSLEQPFSIFLPWRNPWNNFQVSGNPCIKIIISTAHGTLVWSVSCIYNNPIIIINVLLSRELYFSVDLFILANKFKKDVYFFFNHDLSRNP